MKKIYLLLMALSIGSSAIHAQNKEKKDTLQTAADEQKSDRNVMLNAASANSGPRNVNFGLPATSNITVLENDLPVVYFFWPEMPHNSWRMDAMTNGIKLFDLGQTAINIGDVGFSVGTYDNLGTNNLAGNIALNSNHFGLLNGTGNISGPLNKNGLKYSVGAFVNYDPGTYKVNKTDINRYYNDQTHIFKVALTQDYKFCGGSGSITAFYKYAKSKWLNSHYAPYKYHLDGSVSEIEGFKIGSDNYVVGKKFTVRDATTGDVVERDAFDDYGSRSHTLDLIGKNKFESGLFVNYIMRFHSARSGQYASAMTQIQEKTYTNGQGNSVTDNLQGVLTLASKRTPILSVASLFEVGKKSGSHDWKIGLNQWMYNIDDFITEGSFFFQTVEANPQKVTDSSYGFNEYHNGTENKIALFMTDKWDVWDVLNITMGARFEYLSLNGDFIDNKDKDPTLPYLSNKRSKIKKDFFNKTFSISAVYKMTKSFGLLGEATYNEQSGHLENYSAGNDPNLKKSKISGAGFGLFYNHSLFRLVSKATYIKRDEYRTTVNFTGKAGVPERALASYDIETIGWTTDIMATPFKNFNLHFLVTFQAPKYKNYTGKVNFSPTEIVDYNFNNNNVMSVSKVLMEIDPSYQWKKLRVWGSARYFSKEYANLSNTLFFKGRWETFAGANYFFNKHLTFSANVVNLLNQRGAKSRISGADLFTAEDAKKMEGAIVSGSYIRPFTVEFGMKYRF